jgi:malate dehydrogenase (oxaloacetate-decarboxylating)(NADP+)
MPSPATETDTTAKVPPDFPRGVKLLHDPVRNKGTAFSAAERDALGLRGLLPPRILTADAQVARAMEIINQKPTDLEKFIYLISLQDRNENLFYRVVMDNINEIMPIIYTPTVGKACQMYGHIFRRPRGMWLSLEDRGRMADVLANWPHRDEVRIVVVTDGERILGLGDQGADGMGIPVGKLSLYTACAGIPPTQCLPVTLDVGTNNQDKLKDPLYIGLPRPRLTGGAYDAFVDEFMETAAHMFPKAVLQLEDFANHTAFRLLNKYRDDYCIFDDDIQGTGSVILAGLYAAQRITGVPLKDQRYLFLGAGEAGIGIADLIVAAMLDEGVPRDEALASCWFFDSKGLVVKGRTDLVEHKRPYAHDHAFTDDFLAVIQDIRPAAIIGVSGKPQTFTRPIVEAMAEINARPLVFSLSNPTSKSECTAQQAYEWSGGRAVFASGSPFDPVDYQGQTFVPGQGNNAYIFPGVGLGAIVCEATHVTDEMFFEAAKALAGQVSDSDLRLGRVYPSITRIREVSAHIAVAVCEVAYQRGLARVPRPADLLGDIKAAMFDPSYTQYV